MTTYIALPRGINLAGNKKVAMSDLRQLLARLGFGNPRSILNSGNLLFEAPTRAPAKLEQLLEAECAKRLLLTTAFHVRTAAELDATIAKNPLPKEARSDPSHLLVVFYKEAPAPSGLKALEAARTGPELVRLKGREAFIYYPDGMARPQLTPALLDRHLGRGTGRNWNTVQKLAALAGA